ncbi:hypothetical protein MSWHS_2545 [Methanosarcina sp. WWM596]|nr:hypothetical protein MSWHS_2545 [Methanosarcina sp. WWM596]AKB22770.1 hypothetical protein MSWH1_2499 [Methanosarcina sp. WH1]
MIKPVSFQLQASKKRKTRCPPIPFFETLIYSLYYPFFRNFSKRQPFFLNVAAGKKLLRFSAKYPTFSGLSPL